MAGITAAQPTKLLLRFGYTFFNGEEHILLGAAKIIHPFKDLCGPLDYFALLCSYSPLGALILSGLRLVNHKHRERYQSLLLIYCSFVSVFSSNLWYRAPLSATRGRARSLVLRPRGQFSKKPIQDRGRSKY